MGEVWDAIPFLAKLQIVATIGILEHISEDKNFLAADGTTHYMRGGKPGYMPTFKANVHPCPFNLYDPFNLSTKMTEDKKAKRLNMEVNNGRLAILASSASSRSPLCRAACRASAASSRPTPAMSWLLSSRLARMRRSGRSATSGVA